MAVYYKFKSAKDYDSISIDGHFISVVNLKERIFESKHLGRGTDFDLVVTNAHTNEEYLDEALLIPKNTSVLVRRVPGRPRMPIVTQPDEPKSEAKAEDDQTSKVNFMATDFSVLKDFGVSDFDDEFGNDLYAIPEMPPGLSSNNLIQDTAAPSKVDEDSKIKAFVESSGFDWQRQATDGFVRGRGFGHDGRGGRGYGRSAGGLERKTPPQGYICHRCKVAGHFIQHCPTNSDPSYDKKKVKPPTGIPKSMLEAAPEGSYALPSGTAAVLKPNEAAFEREIEGLPSTRSVGDLPPELHCPLCKEVMKDAVLTSRCCFKSFCDKCIRDYIISRSICVCGARDVLADDLLPNKTLRDTINRILESGNSSADNTGSAVHVQDMESARYPPPKFPSPTQSAAAKGEQRLPPATEETQNTKEIYNGNKPIDAEKPQVQMQNSEKEKINRVPDVSEATHESASVKELPSQGSALHVEEEIQQKVNAADAGKKKKKKKKMPLPMNAPDMQQMQWQGMQPCVDGYMGPSNFNPYWQGMQPPMDGFICPFPGNLHGNIPFMGYGVGPVDPFGNVLPPDPFGPQNIMAPPMFHPPPQRDIAADFGMNMNVRPPLMSREEFEARKAEVRKKREMERRVESREIPRDREYIREVSNSVNAVPVKSKPMPPSVRRSPSVDRYERERDHDCHRGRDRSRDRGSMDRDHDRVRDGHYHRSSHSHSHSLRSERVSPSRSSRDSDVPRSSLKRKSEHHEPDHDNGHRDHVHEREPRHRHFSQSSFLQPSQAPAAPAPEPVPALTASAAAASLDNKHKSSVFSRISFPEEELAAKKRKVSAEPKTKSSSSKTAANKDPEASGSGSGRRHHHHHNHNATASSSSSLANGYHHHSSVKKSMATDMDYESSDDERHFKRKPSRYEPSPPPEEEGVPRRSRDHKHR